MDIPCEDSPVRRRAGNQESVVQARGAESNRIIQGQDSLSRAFIGKTVEKKRSLCCLFWKRCGSDLRVLCTCGNPLLDSHKRRRICLKAWSGFDVWAETASSQRPV